MIYPDKALSIMQPWAWLIVNGWKDIENRDWRTSHRGGVLVHAGKTIDQDAWQSLNRGRHPVTGEMVGDDVGMAWAAHHGNVLIGGVVGQVEIVDVVSESTSPWFVGDYGFVLRNGQPLPFMPCRGSLGIRPFAYRPPA